MIITLDITPEVEAELVRQPAAQGRAIESVAAALLEGAVQSSTQQPEHGAGQSLIDAFAEILDANIPSEVMRPQPGLP